MPKLSKPKTPKWKYAKGKEPIKGRYLYFEDNKSKDLVISNWSFDKYSSESPLFRCYVTKLDGEDVDKLWSVWDYEFTQVLKKKLKGKQIHEKVSIKIMMHYDKKEDERTFEIIK